MNCYINDTTYSYLYNLSESNIYQIVSSPEMKRKINGEKIFFLPDLEIDGFHAIGKEFRLFLLLATRFFAYSLMAVKVSRITRRE